MYKWAHTLWELRIPVLPGLITATIRLLFGAYIPYTAKIGRNTNFAYGGMSVAVHPRSVIGENCTIAHGVTIGGRSGHEAVPILGNDICVGVGAAILGPVSIGDNAIIGANAVVIHDVPANTTVAGVPARVIKKNNSVRAAKAG
jgi:serine O-acetyltransferase